MIKKIKYGLGLIKTSYNKPAHIKAILNDIFKSENKSYSNKEHLKSAMEWLCRAQDVTGCGGVSGGYYLYKGWGQPYPETTGYIIPTFISYAKLIKDDNYIKRAISMGDWEIKIQLPSGAVRGEMGINDSPAVFDTGQVIFGWLSLYNETRQNRFMDAAIKAGDWLMSVQDKDGKWSKHIYQNTLHTYNTRVAWSLMELYNVTNNKRYKTAAEKNILWAMDQARENGWFNHMSFSDNHPPHTHTIAYTLRGLLESSFYLSGETKQKVVNIVKKASENMVAKYESREYLPATLNENWESKDTYSCLTGNVQISIILLTLVKHRLINNGIKFLNVAQNLIDQVKIRQSVDSKHLGIEGAIPGSYPIWGGYMPFAYPNWAAKFFADAIML